MNSAPAYLKSVPSNEFDLIVIGAGVGGLMTAAICGKRGLKVLVLEANEESVGAGRCGSFTLADDFRFDSGPSLLLLPDVYGEAFEAAGSSDLWNDIVVSPVQGPRYHIFFDDGLRPLPNDPPLVLFGGASDQASFEALELAERGGTVGGGQSYLDHMVQSQRILDGGLPNFIEGNLRLPALAQMIGEVVRGAWPLETQVQFRVEVTRLRNALALALHQPH
jgi:phytoene dehydrogenase-like protein